VDGSEQSRELSSWSESCAMASASWWIGSKRLKRSDTPPSPRHTKLVVAYGNELRVGPTVAAVPVS